MKKLFSTFMLVMCTFCAWAYDAEVDGIYYNLNADSKEATVTYKNGDYNSYSGDVVIPDSIVYNDVYYAVTSIGSNAFQWCADLTSITIGNSVESINDFAFYGCYGLKSLVIPNSVTYIGESAFSGCAKITSATLSESLTSIEPSVFYFCLQLESINIPESVTSIGKDAFYNCSNMKTVTIGSSVASIGNFAFYECYGLESVTNLAATPQTISTSTFFSDKIKLGETDLFVPQASVDAYKEANIWQKFHIVGIEENGIESINDNENDGSTSSPQVRTAKCIENGRVIITLPDGKKYATDGKQL